jgi:uncharacterized protein (DUF736 family)
MATIGYVTRKGNGFEGKLTTLTISAALKLIPNSDKKNDKQPDYIALSNGVEIGAAWNKLSKEQNEYVSLTIDTLEFPQPIYANLGRAPGQDDPDTFAIIWNRPPKS